VYGLLKLGPIYVLKIVLEVRASTLPRIENKEEEVDLEGKA